MNLVRLHMNEDFIPYSRGRAKGTVHILLDGTLPRNQLECLIWSLGFEKTDSLTAYGESKKYVNEETSLIIREGIPLEDYSSSNYGIYMRRNNFVNSLPKDSVIFAKQLKKYFRRVRVLKEFPGEEVLYDSSTCSEDQR